MPISLESLMSSVPGIDKFDPERWYRVHGANGLADFHASGEVRANPKGKYPSTYYSKGGVESRYLKNGRGAIVEAMDGVDAVPDSRRYGITQQEQNLTKADRIRVWELMKDGKYAPIYDNITPWKYGARVLRDSVAPPALVLGAIEGALTGFNTPTEKYEQSTGLNGGLARTLGVMGDVGDSITFGSAGAIGRAVAAMLEEE